MSDDRSGDEPTDVLAAEEFGVPAPDPAFQPEDLRLPADLVGNEPRDVLAAEEFAMPAPEEARVKRSRLEQARRPKVVADRRRADARRTLAVAAGTRRGSS